MAPKNYIAFDVDVVPEIRVIQSTLSRVAAQLRGYKKPLETAVRQVLAPRIYNNFDTNGASGEWAPLSIETVKWKLTNGFARVAFEPLKRTGKLQKRAGQVNLWKVTTDSTSLEFLPEDVEYGIYHQQGYINARTGTEVPARPWAVILESDIDAVEQIIETYAWVQLGSI